MNWKKDHRLNSKKLKSQNTWEYKNCNIFHYFLITKLELFIINFAIKSNFNALVLFIQKMSYESPYQFFCFSLQMFFHKILHILVQTSNCEQKFEISMNKKTSLQLLRCTIYVRLNFFFSKCSQGIVFELLILQHKERQFELNVKKTMFLIINYNIAFFSFFLLMQIINFHIIPLILHSKF